MIQFILGLISGVIITLVGHWLTRRAKRKEDRQAVIDAVASEYHRLKSSAHSGELQGLIRAGVGRLDDNSEVEAAVLEIGRYGHPDPLGPFREVLEGKDVAHFFKVVTEQQNRLVTNSDIRRAAEATRELE